MVKLYLSKDELEDIIEKKKEDYKSSLALLEGVSKKRSRKDDKLISEGALSVYSQAEGLLTLLNLYNTNFNNETMKELEKSFVGIKVNVRKELIGKLPN